MTTTIDDEEENPRDRSMPIRIREGQIWGATGDRESLIGTRGQRGVAVAGRTIRQFVLADV